MEGGTFLKFHRRKRLRSARNRDEKDSSRGWTGEEPPTAENNAVDSAGIVRELVDRETQTPSLGSSLPSRLDAKEEVVCRGPEEASVVEAERKTLVVYPSVGKRQTLLPLPLPDISQENEEESLERSVRMRRRIRADQDSAMDALRNLLSG